MPGKWGGAPQAHPPRSANKTRMPDKWGGARRARPPLDPPMLSGTTCLHCPYLCDRTMIISPKGVISEVERGRAKVHLMSCCYPDKQFNLILFIVDPGTNANHQVKKTKRVDVYYAFIVPGVHKITEHVYHLCIYYMIGGAIGYF